MKSAVKIEKIFHEDFRIFDSKINNENEKWRVTSDNGIENVIFIVYILRHDRH